MIARSKSADQHAYPAEKARGGEIILRTRSQRAVFIAGLAGAIILAILVVTFAH